MARYGDLDTQYFDDAGDPLINGKIFFFETGTTTPKPTFADVNFTIPNAHPVILTAAGRQPNIFFQGVAKAVLATSAGVQILVRDPVGETASTFGNPWIASKDYNANDVVQGSDGDFYRSLVNGNVNNNPVTTSGSWTFLYSVEWSAGTTYKTGSVVTYETIVYQSLQNANLNQNPSTATSFWVPIQLVWKSTSVYALNANVVGTDGILYTSLQAANTGNIPASSPTFWVGTSAAAASSATAAAASASAASTSATNAAASASTATTQATNAATSASNASTSATNASTSATNAAASASSASTSASSATSSASSATSSATAASASASAAATSETNAANSATAASGSASTASTQATNAAASASTATTAATNAGTSETNAAASASTATTQATNASNSATSASTSASNASTSASNAATSATNAANSFDLFDDRFLGAKASDPAVDNDGNPLVTGTIYFNTTTNAMRVYNVSAFQDVAPVATSINVGTQVTGVLNVVNGGTGLSTLGTAGQALVVNSGATGLEYATIDTNATLGTLTKTFTANEVSTISLTKTVLTPVVSVTKEVPQTGVTNNEWDVNSTTENYERLNSAPATTLNFVGFDISTASFVDSFSVSAQETEPMGIAFNTTGTKMFVVGKSGDDVNEYTLSVAFDVSTATFVDSFSVSAQDSQPHAVSFNTDGTKMFVLGYTGQDVNEYTLSTGFDVSTATFVDSFSVASQETEPRGMAFSTDGTKMFISGNSGKDINEYALSTGFDVSTASFTDSFSVLGQDTYPTGIAFNSDGTKMFFVGSTGDAVYAYNLSTGFDVSTAVYSKTFSVSGQDSEPQDVAFNPAGTKMFIVGDAGDDVNEYDLDFSALQLGTGSFTSADVGKTIEANSGVFVLTSTSGAFVETTAPTSYNQVASGNWDMYGVVYNAVDGDLELSSVQTGQFDVSTSAFVKSFSISAQGLDPTGIAFNTTGTKMFVVTESDQDVNEYTLSTAFDVSTAAFVDAFNVSAQDSNPRGLAFSTNGTKMFIVGAAGLDVNEYTLSTGFDVSTASFVDSFSVSSQDDAPREIAFNTNGTKMFLVGDTGNDVNEYTLSTGFDVSTASFVDSFSVASQETSPRGIAFNTNGTKMFITGISGDDVNEYTLSTGFDVSTASFVDSFSVASQDTSPHGIAFNSDGTKMFIAGQEGDDVNQYSVGTLFSPSGYQPVHTKASIDTTYWIDINDMTANESAGSGKVLYALSNDNRISYTVVSETLGARDIVRNNAGTWQYNSNGTYASETWTNATTNAELPALAQAMEGASFTVGYEIAASTFVDGFSVAAQTGTPRGIFFSADGTKMYTIGSSSVYQYTLSTGFDVSTASYASKTFNFNSQDSSPLSVAFSADGTKMYVVGYTNKSVFQYTLSTAYDVTTASYASKSISVSSQESDPYGLAFNNDGTKLYVIGTTGDDVNEYALSTAYDVSTGSFTTSFSVSSQETSPYAVAFSADGTKMFIAGGATARVYRYSLSTAFSVSTASYDSVSFNVSSQETTPNGIAFNLDGTKMFVIGYDQDKVNEYNSALVTYPNQMNKTQLDAVTDPNQITLGNDFDLAIIFNLTSGTTVPSSNGVSINYDANVLNEGAILGTDYDFDAPAGDKARITALIAGNYKVRVV
jgi:DNA-binding beta-propeller fold protein YncE